MRLEIAVLTAVAALSAACTAAQAHVAVDAPPAPETVPAEALPEIPAPPVRAGNPATPAVEPAKVVVQEVKLTIPDTDYCPPCGRG